MKLRSLRFGASLAALLVAGSTTACLPHERLVSRTCEWADSSFVADTTNADHRWHIDRDVEIAEELGVRYGDTFRQSLGVTGLGKKRVECTDRMLHAVAESHALPLSYVLSVRGHRDWRFDAAAILLPCAILILVGMLVVTRKIEHSLRAHPARLRLLVTLLAAIAVVGVAMLFTDYWGFIAENRRVDDGHMSYRAEYRVMATHTFEIFTGGLMLAWSAAAAMRRR